AVTRMRLALRRVLRNDRALLSGLAVAVGAGAAGGAILFREAIGGVQWLGFGFLSERVHSLAADLPWWHLLAVPALGGLAIGIFVHYVMPGRRNLGVADVTEAMALRGGRMSVGAGLGAALSSAASIGVGASVGREGPVVHLGASLASWVAARLDLGSSQTRTLLGCGVAAAVAASFNAPIAGVFFALEVVIGHYALSAFAPIVIASVTGTILSRGYFGDFPAFIVPGHEIVSFLEFPAYALLGVVSAVAAILFMRAIFLAEDVAGRLPVPAWSRPAFVGLAVGAIALVFPQILGVGYEATDAALRELFPLWLLLALVAVKIAATAICLGAGFGGGVFSPSLFVGAMLGGAFGIVAASVFPEHAAGQGAYTMIGMGAVAGAVLGAPISTILIIFEITGDYQMTIAVMIAVVIASLLTQQFAGRSYFALHLARRGIDLRGGREVGLLRGINVRQVMSRDFVSVAVGAGAAEVRHALQSAPRGVLLVVDEDGLLYGVITLVDLGAAAFDASLDSLVRAADAARRPPALLTPDDDLETALKALERTGEGRLPVVRAHDAPEPLGFVTEHEAQAAYTRALLHLRAEERGED
ncbi:MAG: chloride channel protein, partial [Alphaproteobacteria bacterium]